MDQDHSQQIAAAMETLATEGAGLPVLAGSSLSFFAADVGLPPGDIKVFTGKRHIGAFEGGAAQAPSAARLFSRFVTCRFSRPGDPDYKGRGLSVRYGFHPGPLGLLMVAVSGRGLCYLGFPIDGDQSVPVQRMRDFMPYAAYSADEAGTAETARAVIKIWGGQADAAEKLALDLHGTPLQTAVWEALLAIPPGRYETYGSLARKLGRPKAARAIGNAVGANPVSVLIPCHRVIRSTGIIDNYGWGSPRKKILLGLEYCADPGAEQKRVQGR